MLDRDAYRNYLLHRLHAYSTGNPDVIVHPAFRQILDEIADNDLCHGSHMIRGMVQWIAEEVAEWLDAVRTHVEAHNPYKAERNLLEHCKLFDNNKFAGHWPLLWPWLGTRYSESELDLPFYIEEFSDDVHIGNDAIRCEFLADWEQALLRKEIRYELEILAFARRQFGHPLENRTKSFGGKALTTKPELCWELEPGQWKTQTFNLLKIALAICKGNESIIRLLNGLGRKSSDRHDAENKSAERHTPNIRFHHAAHSDINGVCESERLDALLPIEIALLGKPKLEREFYRKYVERRLQTFDYRSHEPVSKQPKPFDDTIETAGPYIVCLDTSGSMCGKPEEVAKAICFGLLLRAREERRACYLISYSQRIEVLDLSDWRQNRSQIVDFLSHSFCGGTDLEPAIAEALRMLRTCEFALADVLVISDFIFSNLSPERAEAMRIAQTKNTRFHALRIGTQGNVEMLRRFDSLWNYNPKNRQITRGLPPTDGLFR